MKKITGGNGINNIWLQSNNAWERLLTTGLVVNKELNNFAWPQRKWLSPCRGRCLVTYKVSFALPLHPKVKEVDFNPVKEFLRLGFNFEVNNCIVKMILKGRNIFFFHCESAQRLDRHADHGYKGLTSLILLKFETWTLFLICYWFLGTFFT